MKRILLVGLLCMCVDQIIKNILVSAMSFGNSISVINDFFSITLVQNTGAAFSILSSNTLFLIIVTFFALALIYIFLIKDKEHSKFEATIYGVLMGGIIGNLIDRVSRGFVVDYLDFNIFGINFPVFNLADVCIMVSIGLLIINIYRFEKHKGEQHEIHGK